MANLYNWRNGLCIIQFIVGHKYCTVMADCAHASDVFEAVKAWHEEVDSEGTMVPFVILDESFINTDEMDFYLENDLCQVKVNI